MTLAVAWVRQNAGSSELVIAADSRLSGGETWDACPKILLLPRSDMVLCFAGVTARTYPLMLQAANSIDSFPESRKRIQSVTHAVGHIVRVINDMVGKITNVPKGDGSDFVSDLVSSRFLAAGFDWWKRRFVVFRLFYDQNVSRYVSERRHNARRIYAFIGDVDKGKGINLPEDAKQLLVTLLQQKNKFPKGRLDWEPFEILREMILSGDYPTLGGPIQMAKVYQHSTCQPFGVFWPSRKGGNLTIMGRPTMGYEGTDWPCIDASSLEIVHHGLIKNGQGDDPPVVVDQP